MMTIDQFLNDMDIVILVTRGLVEHNVAAEHVEEAKLILDAMCDGGTKAEMAVRSTCQATLRRNFDTALRQYRRKELRL